MPLQELLFARHKANVQSRCYFVCINKGVARTFGQDCRFRLIMRTLPECSNYTNVSLTVYSVLSLSRQLTCNDFQYMKATTGRVNTLFQHKVKSQ